MSPPRCKIRAEVACTRTWLYAGGNNTLWLLPLHLHSQPSLKVQQEVLQCIIMGLCMLVCWSNKYCTTMVTDSMTCRGVLGSGDVTHFQYDVAEVKLGIKDRPEWIKALVTSG